MARFFDITRFTPLILIVATASHCLAAEQLIETKELSLVIPESWEKVAEDKTLLTVRVGLRQSGFGFAKNIRVKLYDLPDGATLEQLAAVQKKSLGRFKLVAEGEFPAANANISWLAIAPESPTNASDALTKIDYIAVVGKKAFVLHCMTETKTWEADKLLFENIVKSASFKAFK